MKTVLKNWRWIVFGIAVVAYAVVDTTLEYYNDLNTNTRWAQAAYDKGREIGKTYGQCELLTTIAHVQKSQAWSKDPSTAETLAVCAKFMANHEIGVVETLTLPK